MTSELIKLQGIGLQVRDKCILHHVDLNLERGKIVTIIGPNGAGKSSLVKVVLGLLEPSEGTITRSKGLRFGYVPQQLSLDHSMPIKVSRFLSLAGVDKKARDTAMDFLKIRHLASRQMHSLSGGEFQRVMLARAIARKPDLLVLDEPLQGVDITGQVELYQLIASVRDDYGCGILMVSHDLHLVMAQTDTVICLNQHVCCHGQPESVSRHPEYLKLFGENAADQLAVYQHHHDHHHDLHGDAVACDEGCHHD
ncbi:MAG: zinc ABC transporter ATP-binding protein ZnuC [Agarilytica sp.]